MTTNEKSEFGMGLTYCLGLFLAHAERMREYLEGFEEQTWMAYDLWFNGAADHLFDFQPKYAPTETLKKRCKKFQNKVLDLRLVMGRKKATKEDYNWAIKEAKTLLRLIDKANNVPTKKGQRE